MKILDQLDNKINKSGFFDLPQTKICNSPEHQFPSMLYIPPGKGYTHVCPKCGNKITVIGSQITL